MWHLVLLHSTSVAYVPAAHSIHLLLHHHKLLEHLHGLCIGLLELLQLLLRSVLNLFRLDGLWLVYLIELWHLRGVHLHYVKTLLLRCTTRWLRWCLLFDLIVDIQLGKNI